MVSINGGDRLKEKLKKKEMSSVNNSNIEKRGGLRTFLINVLIDSLITFVGSL